MWSDGVHLNKDIVAQSAQVIARVAGLDAPDTTTFFMVMGKEVGPGDLFSREKLSVVVTLWKFEEFAEAIGYVNENTEYNGKGHNCGLHTTSDAHIRELDEKAKVSRIMINQPQCYGNAEVTITGCLSRSHWAAVGGAVILLRRIFTGSIL